MPKIEGILETSLYVADLARSAKFYRDVLGFETLFENRRLVALDAGRQGVLLLFHNNADIPDVTDPGGTIPGHGGAGRLHLAFAIAADALQAWRDKLAARSIALTSEYKWRRGGVSLYFNDPDGHVLELATPGLWPTY
jgi:catechol 2,3-dioxygenase-like lactoylglutathione lyase family enzyme